MLGFGCPVVDQQIVRAFHVVTLQEDEAPGYGAKTFGVDAVNHFDAAGGVELQERGSNGLHISHLGELVANLDGHGRAAETEKNGGGGRLQHDVRADSFDALGGFREKARSEADDQHNKGNFDGDGHHADKGAQRAMQQIAHDELAHHRGFSSAASPTRTRSLPGGCSSLKRSSGSSSFRESLMISMSRR